MLRVFVLAVLCMSRAWGADPQTPRPNSPGASQRVDCNGDVGFSAVGMKRVHSTGLVSYRQTLFDRSVGFSKETGEVTIFCNGVYLITFAGYGIGSNTRVVLKLRGAKNDNWRAVASAGGPSSGGGSNQVLLRLDSGEQAAVWVSSGSLAPDNDVPTTTFSALKLTKN